MKDQDICRDDSYLMGEEVVDVQHSSSTRAAKLLRLEAIRGLAAMYVVLHHTVSFEFLVLGMDLGRLLRFGQEAVILFFIVSGFVIHLSCQPPGSQTFKTYFVKRFVRIYVPLIVVLGIGFIVESYNRGALADVSVTELLGNLLMLQDWPPEMPGVLVDPVFGNNPLWSLSYEWWFYMLYFPLVQLTSNLKRLSLIVFGLSVASAVVYTFWPTFLPRLFMYGAIWWSGVFLADLYLKGQPITLKSCFTPLFVLTLISIILLVKILFWRQAGGALALGKHPVMELRHTGFACFSIVCAVIWHRFKWRGFNQLVGPFVVFAPISYVIYISHYHLMVTATWFDGINNAALEWLLYFLGLLLFAWFVELRLYPALRRRLYARFL